MKLKENIMVSENGFVFDANTGESFNVNTIGSTILSLIKEDSEEIKIMEKLSEIYDVDKFILEKDYYDFISLIKQYGLISNE